MNYQIKIIIVTYICVSLIQAEKKAISNEQDLLLITVATEETDGLIRLRNSAKEFGHELIVFGIGEEWNGGNMRLDTVKFLYNF